MSILFSPVGTADPITALGDGPMLHIVRHCAPTKVVLFLSPTMAEYEARYTESIRLLSEHTNRAEPEVRCVRSKREDVHRFDVYIDDFERLLKGLAAENPEDEILVNVSSGTPAMEQALVALGSFGEMDLSLLQVSTPRNGPGHKGDRESLEDYNLCLLWECNPDNAENEGLSRVEKVASPNFSERLVKQNVKALIAAYDYEAAASTAAASRHISDTAREAIEAAADRLNLDGQKASKVFAKTPAAFRNDGPLREYISMLEVRFNQRHWGDFVRSLTPVVTELMLAFLQDDLDKKQFLKEADLKEGSYILDIGKIEKDERLSMVLGDRYVRGKKTYLTNLMLMQLIDEYSSGRPKRAEVKRLREFEERSRNILAHNLVRVSKDAIERGTLGKGKRGEGRQPGEKKKKITFEEVMGLLFEFSETEPGLYDRINEIIIERW